MTDYLAYITFRVLGPFLRALPLDFSLFLGKLLGTLLYTFDLKHRSLAYSHIRRAVGSNEDVTRRFYQTFGQSLIEIFLIPAINKKYISKYISIDGLAHVEEAFKKGKGVILLGIHAGSWELSNIICANFGFAFNLFVRDQKFPKLEGLLNRYRLQKGCKLIQREGGLRSLMQALKNNEAVGMTADQGGKAGILVDFFGKSASMPTGAVKIALKYGAVILPAYYTRIKGPYQKIVVEKPFELEQSGDTASDISRNVQAITRVFERLILKYPKDYLWTYKIWKYSDQRDILILNDGKTGHLRQSQACARILKDQLVGSSFKVDIKQVDIKYKDAISRVLMNVFSAPWCIKTCLEPETRRALDGSVPDMIISCGSATAPVNYILAKQCKARSIAILKPANLGYSKFDMVVMPRHDLPRQARNVVVTEGALNLIDKSYLENNARMLEPMLPAGEPSARIGVLIGGDTKNFSLSYDIMLQVLSSVKQASDNASAVIFVTTSRRTPEPIEGLVKAQMGSYKGCELLVIANERNFDFAVGGILAKSDIVVVSPESISMVSEAASSGKYIITFKAPVGKKHRRFLDEMARKQYIYFCEPREISSVIGRLLKEKPKVIKLSDNDGVAAAMKRML